MSQGLERSERQRMSRNRKGFGLSSSGRGFRSWPLVLAIAALVGLVACLSCWLIYQAARRGVQGENKVTLEVGQYGIPRIYLVEQFFEFSGVGIFVNIHIVSNIRV